MSCKVVFPPAREACGAVAVAVVKWADGDVTRVCGRCRLHLEQVASQHGTVLKVEPVEGAPPLKKASA